MARPSKLTDGVQDKIVAGIKAGLHIAQAAQLAGISETTFYAWLDRGDAERTPDTPALADMSVTDLQRMAADNSIPFTKRTKRDVLVARLTDAGAESYERYRRFREAVEDAEAELEQRLVAQWQLTMQPITIPGPPGPNGEPTQIVKQHANYQSIATFLARRYPKRWNPKTELEISGPDGGAIVVETMQAREEEIERLRATARGSAVAAGAPAVGDASPAGADNT